MQKMEEQNNALVKSKRLREPEERPSGTLNRQSPDNDEVTFRNKHLFLKASKMLTYNLRPCVYLKIGGNRDPETISHHDYSGGNSCKA
jgi:hypothetical protein